MWITNTKIFQNHNNYSHMIYLYLIMIYFHKNNYRQKLLNKLSFYNSLITKQPLNYSLF